MGERDEQTVYIRLCCELYYVYKSCSKPIEQYVTGQYFNISKTFHRQDRNTKLLLQVLAAALSKIQHDIARLSTKNVPTRDDDLNTSTFTN